MDNIEKTGAYSFTVSLSNQKCLFAKALKNEINNYLISYMDKVLKKNKDESGDCSLQEFRDKWAGVVRQEAFETYILGSAATDYYDLIVEKNDEIATCKERIKKLEKEMEMFRDNAVQASLILQRGEKKPKVSSDSKRKRIELTDSDSDCSELMSKKAKKAKKTVKETVYPDIDDDL